MLVSNLTYSYALCPEAQVAVPVHRPALPMEGVLGELQVLLGHPKAEGQAAGQDDSNLQASRPQATPEYHKHLKDQLVG